MSRTTREQKAVSGAGKGSWTAQQLEQETPPEPQRAVSRASPARGGGARLLTNAKERERAAVRLVLMRTAACGVRAQRVGVSVARRVGLAGE